jgi:hypothetical protein
MTLFCICAVCKSEFRDKQVILKELENIAGNFQPVLLGSEQYWYSRAGPGETVGFTRGRQMSARCYPALTMDVDTSEIMKSIAISECGAKIWLLCSIFFRVLL